MWSIKYFEKGLAFGIRFDLDHDQGDDTRFPIHKKPGNHMRRATKSLFSAGMTGNVSNLILLKTILMINFDMF